MRFQKIDEKNFTFNFIIIIIIIFSTLIFVLYLIIYYLTKYFEMLIVPICHGITIGFHQYNN